MSVHSLYCFSSYKEVSKATENPSASLRPASGCQRLGSGTRADYLLGNLAPRRCRPDAKRKNLRLLLVPLPETSQMVSTHPQPAPSGITASPALRNAARGR